MIHNAQKCIAIRSPRPEAQSGLAPVLRILGIAVLVGLPSAMLCGCSQSVDADVTEEPQHAVAEARDAANTKTDDTDNTNSRVVEMPLAQRVADEVEPQDEAPKTATEEIENDPRLIERDRIKERAAEYARQGKTVLAIEEGERQLELEIAIFGEQSEEITETLDTLIELYTFEDRLDEARATTLRSQKITTAAFGEDNWRVNDHNIVLDYIDKLEEMDPDERWQMLDSEEQATVMLNQRRFLDAIEFREDALTGYLKHFGRNHMFTAVILLEIARCNLALRELDQAEKQLKDCLQILENTVGTDHPHYGWTLDLLAEHSLYVEDYDRAEAYYLQSTKIQEAAFGNKHNNYSTAINNLATLYDGMGRYEDAVPLYREAIAIIRPAEGDTNLDYDITMTNLARALVEIARIEAREDNFAKALNSLREARELRADRFGPTHWLVTNLDVEIDDLEERKSLKPEEIAQLREADDLFDEANRLDQEEQDYEAALAKAQQATQIVEKLLGREHIQYAWKSHKVADLLLALDSYDEAKPMYRHAEAILSRVLGNNDPRYATALADQGRLYFYTGEYDRASPLFETALEIYGRLSSETSSQYDFGYEYDLYYADAISYLGTIKSDEGDYTRAEQLFKHALLLYRRYNEDDPSSYATGLYDLGSLYLRIGDNIHAEPLLQEALQVTKDHAGAVTFEYADRLTSLGTLYTETDRYSEAETVLQEAVEIFEQLAPDYEDYLSLSLYQLGTTYRLQDRFKEARPLLERVREIDARFYGKDHTEYATTLNQLGVLYTATEQYEEAGACFEESLSIWQQHYDPTDSFCGRILYNHAYVLADAIKFEQASELLSRANEVYEHVAGEDPPSAAYEFLDIGTLYDRIEEPERATAALQRSLELCRNYISNNDEIVDSELMTLASTLRSLGPILVERDDLAAALEAARQLLVVEERLYGVEHWQFTNAKLNLSEVQHLSTLGDDELDKLERADGEIAYAQELLEEDKPDEAFKSQQHAYELYEEVLGKNHRDTISLLIDLSDLATDIGRRTDAEPLLAEAVKRREVLLGKLHPDYSVIVTQVGNLYRDLGQYAQAEHYLRLALDIDNEIYGQNHEWYAQDLKNLASLYNMTANPSQGLPVARQAADIFHRLRGEENSNYLESLNLMAIFYHFLRDYEPAQELYKHVLAKRTESLGEDAPSTLTSMNNLAVLYSDTGNYEDAERLMRRVFEVRQELFGERSAVVAMSMRNLGDLYSMQGQLDQAVELYTKSLAVRREIEGPTHPVVAELEGLIGRVYVRQKNYAEAEPLLQATLEVQLKNPDENLTDIASSYFALARLCYATNRVPEAIEHLDQSLSLDQKLIERLSTLTERDIQANHEAQSYKLDNLIAMAASTPGDEVAVRKAFDWTLRRKAAVLDTMCRLRAVEDVFDLEPEIAREASRLRELRQEIADLGLNPPAGKSPQEILAIKEPLEQEAQEVESSLRRTLQNRRSTQIAELPNAEQVRQRLPEDSALVEFVRAGVYEDEPGSTYFSTEHYFAFVITANDPAVKMIDLGDGDEIDSLIGQLREETENTPQGLRVIGEAGLEATFAELSNELYQKIFLPLSDALGNATTIMLAPDRALHMVPFAALVDNNGKYLIESLHIGHLSTGRDLLRTFNETGRGTAVFAGPNYDLLLADRVEKANEMRDMVPSNFALAMRGDETETRSMRWRHLAGAEQEAVDVQQAVTSTDYGPVKMHVGDAALEDLFKEIESPRILHVATHGFFIKQREEEEQFAPDVMPTDDRYAAAVGFARLRNSSDPLMRSGIVLAGANDLISSGESSATAEDGWVTAAEIAMLDLNGTEMVVLSACESGLGDISTREGVFGLRRSFFHAGAHALVTSLFKVPDNETRLLMQRFYQELAAGNSKLDALREAQLSVIKRRRETNEAAHPFFWASFVLVGDPS